MASSVPPPVDAVVPPDAVMPQTRPGNFAVLRQRNFAWFLTGTTLSNSGQWIQQVTLS